VHPRPDIRRDTSGKKDRRQQQEEALKREKIQVRAGKGKIFKKPLTFFATY